MTITTTKLQIKTFFDLDAWKKAHGLTLDIYSATKAFPSEEKFGITSQLRRAASSIGANITEGFARYHYKDKVRFYHNARGSAAEVQNFIVLARDLGYVGAQLCTNILQHSDDVAQLINGLIRAIEKQNR